MSRTTNVNFISIIGSEEEKTCFRTSDKDGKLGWWRDVSPSQGLLQSAIAVISIIVAILMHGPRKRSCGSPILQTAECISTRMPCNNFRYWQLRKSLVRCKYLETWTFCSGKEFNLWTRTYVEPFSISEIFPSPWVESTPGHRCHDELDWEVRW